MTSEEIAKGIVKLKAYLTDERPEGVSGILDFTAVSNEVLLEMIRLAEGNKVNNHV